MNIDYPRFVRICQRCAEIAAEPDVSRVVQRGYEERVRAPVEAFLEKNAALLRAEAAARKERGESVGALAEIDQHYAQTRAAARLHMPDVAVPATLKSQETDTDKMNAIRALLSLLDEHDDAPGWAQDLMQGPFGQKAAAAVGEVAEAIAASKTLDDAVKARAEAFAVAYERYLPFKDVVRATYGASSARYRRIHVRANGKLSVDDPEGGEEKKA